MSVSTPSSNKGATGRDLLDLHRSVQRGTNISPTNTSHARQQVPLRSPPSSQNSTKKSATNRGSSGSGIGSSSSSSSSSNGGGFFNKILKRSSTKSSSSTQASPSSKPTSKSSTVVSNASSPTVSKTTGSGRRINSSSSLTSANNNNSNSNSNNNHGTFSGSSFSTYGMSNDSDSAENISHDEGRTSRLPSVRRSSKTKLKELSKSVSRGHGDRNSMSIFDEDNSSMYDDDLHSVSDISAVSSIDDEHSLGSSTSYLASKPGFTSADGIASNQRYSTSGLGLLEDNEKYDHAEQSSYEGERPQDWANISKEALVAPSYLRVSKRKRQAPKILDNLFLAQELNTNMDLKKSQNHTIDLDTLSTDSATDHPNDTDHNDMSFLSESTFDSEEENEVNINNIKSNNAKAFSNGDKKKNQNEIFVMEFSRDGKYLATAGRDSVIRIWKVISSPLARLEYKSYEEANKENTGKKESVDNIDSFSLPPGQNEISSDKKNPCKVSMSKSTASANNTSGANFGKNGTTSANGSNNNGEYRRSKTRLFPNAPVFHQEPVRIFRGHSHNILSLDWSKNNFLISGSMDRTVRLWHIDKYECLQTFPHEDFVTTVKFHPTDDRFFLSGSLDNRLRLWSIIEQNIAYVNDLGDDVLITAASFTPDGTICLAGGFNGSFFTLETKGLQLIARYEVKEKHVNPFHDKNGNKITGIKVFERNEDESKENHSHFKKHAKDDKDDGADSKTKSDPMAKWNVLVTTNDSKVRLVNSHQKKLVTRFKGLTNNSSSIVADISYDHQYIISGSEDHWCYVWKNNNSIINNKLKNSLTELMLDGKHQLNDLHQKHKKYTNLLHANKFMKKLNLQKFLETEGFKYEYIANENSSYSSFHAHHTKVNAAIFAPLETSKLLELSDDCIYDLMKKYNSTLSGRDNEAYVEPGYIIITTDEQGCIRVFRQDTAIKFRKQARSYGKKFSRKRSVAKKDSNETPGSNSDEISSFPLSHTNSSSKLYRSKSTKGRSLSPVASNFKNRISGKIKSGNSIPNSPVTTTSAEFTNNSLDASTLSTNSSINTRPKIVSSSSLINGRQKPQSPPQTNVVPANNYAVNLPDPATELPSLKTTLLNKDESATTIKDSDTDLSRIPSITVDSPTGSSQHGSKHSIQPVSRSSGEYNGSPVIPSHSLTQSIGDISFKDKKHREPPQNL
ncbi:hypothetical protein CLIB1423_06S00188 [[Candida] railenensis]|uniref:WD40 repeat-like protein n=1 Tax=[Candida] railenensis TaxID=45579 RepID=A0A9P0VY54_9ASCO|nr:hypothetical protein CLIB1423_06S00188 [[Candida] railenensis]